MSINRNLITLNNSIVGVFIGFKSSFYKSLFIVKFTRLLH
ncbi:hypothetical protein FM106_31610 [Brachybacterium faecium]|nr:hypothetical protein FM106_31610 [Brachybacterium faecium]